MKSVNYPHRIALVFAVTSILAVTALTPSAARAAEPMKGAPRLLALSKVQNAIETSRAAATANYSMAKPSKGGATALLKLSGGQPTPASRSELSVASASIQRAPAKGAIVLGQLSQRTR